MASPTLDREVELKLRAHEARYTRARRRVVAALAQADGPRSAAELHNRLGEFVPLSSLYRSLAILEEAGVVVPHNGARTVTRYELAEWLAGHHHHLVCMECGAVEDVEVTDGQERRLRKLVAHVSVAADFEPVDHALEIEGRCARCR